MSCVLAILFIHRFVKQEWRIMKEDNNEYQDLNDIDSFNNPPEYEQDVIFDRSSNDSNRSLLSDKKAIAVIISISLTAVAIVIGIWLSLFANSSKSNINAGEPSKKCVQLRTQVLSAKANLKKIIEKAKDLPILAVASKSLENAIYDSGNALAKSSNNYQELRQSYQKIKAVISQYEDRIKKVSDRFLSRDGNGYPFDAPHPQDDQGGYIPMGRSQNSESSEQNDQSNK